MKFYITILLAVSSLVSFAQKVENEGKTYEVKKERIFLNGEDVTDTLNVEKRSAILKEASSISDRLKAEEIARKSKEKAERKKAKAAKKLEKDVKKAEKEQKRAEKALKKEKKLKE